MFAKGIFQIKIKMQNYNFNNIKQLLLCAIYFNKINHLYVKYAQITQKINKIFNFPQDNKNDSLKLLCK